MTVQTGRHPSHVRSRIGAIGLALALSLGDGPIAAQSPAPGSSPPGIGMPAPDFSVVDTRGATRALTDFRGQWLVLEWFSHDCPYTRKHYRTSNMQKLQRAYTGRGVVWLSVVSSAPGKEGYRTAAEANRLTEEKGAVPTAVVRDTAGTLGRAYDARTTPHLFVIDREGVLRYAGAIDDKPTARVEDVPGATNHLHAALEAGLAGRPIAVTRTQPYGCLVQY